MSATLTTSTPTGIAAGRLGPRVRAGQILLTVLLALCGLIAVSTAFADDPFPRPAVVLVASFGVIAALFGCATVWSIGSSRIARVVVWALPLFFITHVAALGTWVPDAAFAVMAALGALLAQPGRRRG